MEFIWDVAFGICNLESYRDASFLQIGLHLRDRVFPIMEDGSGEHGAGLSEDETFVEMVERAHAP